MAITGTKKFRALVQDFVSAAAEQGYSANRGLVAAELEAPISAVATQLHITEETALRNYLDDDWGQEMAQDPRPRRRGPVDLADHHRPYPTPPCPATRRDLRLPWERPAPPGRLTPARVRRGFRNIRAAAAQPAGAPKPGKPGPGRPPGSKNRHPRIPS